MSYCMDCRRIDDHKGTCSYCKSASIKRLKIKTPVNVIGTKIKGNVLNVKDQVVNILCKGEGNSKQIRQYQADQLRKIL